MVPITLATVNNGSIAERATIPYTAPASAQCGRCRWYLDLDLLLIARRHNREDDRLAKRRRMVEHQIRRRGIADPRVLDAMVHVPREAFIPKISRPLAFEDRALPVAKGQTISQPYIVAYMTAQLSVAPDHRVLEIGTGTGYQTAILARLADHVYSVERISALHETAAANLEKLGVTNVTLATGDGTLGLPDHAPYDRIIVTAAAPRVPEVLVDQLVDGGIMVVPVGGANEQTLIRVVRTGDRAIETATLACRFVKLIGAGGWEGPDPSR
jgi:protein-L-isoaspartate(D-aspartate) O-methyltransferase